MQLYPSPVLAPFVSHYLILENDTLAVSNHRFFPDGHPGLLFHYKGIFGRQGEDGRYDGLQKGMLYGQVDRFFNIVTGSQIGLLIVIFKPYGLAAFTPQPPLELTNQTVSMQDVFGAASHDIVEQVILAKDHSERINAIESFLIKRIQAQSNHFLLAKSGVQLLDERKGLISVKAVSDHFSISERTLERAFKATVGLGPKQYGRIARLQHYLKLRKNNPGFNITAAGYEAGYYDQAHLIREFSELAGLTPGEYDQSTSRLAVNLTALNRQ